MNMLKKVTDMLARLKIGGSADAKLSKLDFGVLEVSLMVAALDGEILASEIAAFNDLARKCRGYSEENGKAAFRAALRAAGYLMAMAKVGGFTEEERVDAFVESAEKALPFGFAGGSQQDVRRAFVTWVAMGVSDGDYSGIERKAIEALTDCFSVQRAVKANQDAATLAAIYPNYSPTAQTMAVSYDMLKNVKLLPDDFLAKAEALVRELGDDGKATDAEKSLSELIG